MTKNVYSQFSHSTFCSAPYVLPSPWPSRFASVQLQYGHCCHMIKFLIKFSNLYDLEDREANIFSPLTRPKVARAALGFFIG